MAEAIAQEDPQILKTNRLNIAIKRTNDDIVTFTATSRDTGEYVGHASLMISQRGFGKVGELTYELSQNFRGQCYATEILRTSIAYIYAELGLVSLYGLAPQKNLAAQYVLQRIGFALNEKLEDTIRYEAWNPGFRTAYEG